MTKSQPTTANSAFQNWIQNHNGKTSLEEQIDLARKLYQEATAGLTEESPRSTKAIIHSLEQTPIESTDSLVSWRGIHVGWFLNQFCQTPYMRKLKDFGCQLWFVRKVCIIEMVRQAKKGNSNGQVLSGPFVDHLEHVIDEWKLDGKTSLGKSSVLSQPTVFLSYTGAYTLEYLMDVMQQLDENDYIWMDIFCVNQFAWTGKGRSEEMKSFRSTFMDDLQESIAKIGKTALVLKKWDDVMITLEQIWVLWEIFNTAQGGANLEMLLPQDQISKFISDCLHGEEFENIQKSLASIDAMKAKAQEEQDRSAIFEQMEKVGLFNVNSEVIGKMREWLITVGNQHLERMRDHGPVSPLFLNNLAMLHHKQNQYEEALALYNEALKEAEARGSEEGSEMTRAKYQHNIAELMRSKGELTQAESLFRESLAWYRETLNDGHPESVECINGLALTLKDKGDLREASQLFQEALAASSKLKLYSYFHIANNLAMVYQMLGNVEQAEPLYRSAKLASEKQNGKNHPESLKYSNNLATLLYTQERLTEAEQLFQHILAGKRQQLGNLHPSTLSTINNLALTLQDLGRLDEALLLHKEAMFGFEQSFGPLHAETLTATNNMATLLLEQGRPDQAVPLLRQNLEASRMKLGNTHPDTLTSIQNLGTVLNDLGQWQEALLLFREAATGRRAVLGESHPATMRSMNSFLSILQQHGAL